MKNRTIIGIICLILAVVVTFIVAPVINRLSEETQEVVVILKDVKQGSEITKDMVKLEDYAKNNIPKGAITKTETVLGQYAASNLYAGDCLTEAKLTEDGNTAQDVFATLDGSKLAISVTVDSVAASVSGKLQNGDIISFFVMEPGADKATQPSALTYMQVVTTTTSDGIDQDAIVENEDGSFSLPDTVTVLANTEQAKLLASYEGNASIHVAFVYRGDKKTADKFLAIQDAYFVNEEDKPNIFPLEGGEGND